jgi:hypothetical protein
MFYLLEGMMERVSIGLQAYLVIDSTSLTMKFRGQLATTCVVDVYNWLFLVDFVILEGESNESWR